MEINNQTQPNLMKSNYVPLLIAFTLGAISFGVIGYLIASHNTQKSQSYLLKQNDNDMYVTQVTNKGANTPSELEQELVSNDTSFSIDLLPEGWNAKENIAVDDKNCFIVEVTTLPQTLEYYVPNYAELSSYRYSIPGVSVITIPRQPTEYTDLIDTIYIRSNEASLRKVMLKEAVGFNPNTCSTNTINEVIGAIRFDQ